MKTCKICNVRIHSNEKSVQCISCAEFFHSDTKDKNCAEISPTEERVISLTSVLPKLLYRCTECSQNSNSSQYINSKKFSDILDQFNTSILNFKEATETFKGLSEKVNELHQNQQEIIQDKLPEMNKRLSELESKSSSQDNSHDVIATQKIIAEINEQKNLSKNVIIFNLKDSPDEEKNLKNVNKLLKNNNINVKNISVKRLGIFDENKCRPVKIIFRSYYDAINMLKKSKAIMKNSKQNIYITNDKTKSQQLVEKKVIQELHSRREKGEKNIIKKYINNIPTIVTIDEPLESDNEPNENSENSDDEDKLDNEENNNNDKSSSSIYTTPEKINELQKKKHNDNHEKITSVHNKKVKSNSSRSSILSSSQAKGKLSSSKTDKHHSKNSSHQQKEVKT